jgi:hypothetical protein
MTVMCQKLKYSRSEKESQGIKLVAWFDDMWFNDEF